MSKTSLFRAAAVAALAAAVVIPAHADIRITEAAPWASGNSPAAADWFELTNTGISAVEITGWSMDDSSATPGVAPLLGITSIAAGESVIFMEGDGSGTATFLSSWFGASAPSGLQVGHYAGGGVGLSTGSDGINIFDASNVPQASVSFGASTTGVTFDNAVGLNNTTISQLSVVGVNGAFTAIDAHGVGSPGMIAAVPEPGSYALMLVGLGLVGALASRRKR